MPRFANFAVLLSFALGVPALLPARIVVGSYPATPIQGLALNSSGAIIGDYNGDGVPDAAAVLPDGSIQILFGSPSGFFRKGPQILAAGANQLYATADFNRDGKLDLLALLGSAPNPVQIAVFPGKGNGTFGAPVLTSLADAGNFFAITPDLNKDGYPDLVISGNDTTVDVLLGTGTGTFMISARFSGLQCANGVSSDFDGDGHPDLAMSCQYPMLLPGNGDGTFGQPIQIDTVDPATMVAADLDHDGLPDLVVSVLTDGIPMGMMNVYLNTGGFHFVPTQYSVDALFSSGPGTRQIGVADLDGDGIPDLFVSGSSVEILFGVGGGSFASIPETYAQVSGLNLVATDMNHDGVPDLIETTIPLRVLLGTDSGRFLNPPELAISGTLNTFAVPRAKIDLDSDGLDDLVFSSYDTSGRILLATALNEGNGKFSPSSLNIFSDASRSFDVGCCLSVKDLNGDGRPDLIYGSSTGTVEVSLSSATGTFPAATTVATLPAVSGILAVEAADFNTDGFSDLAALYLANNSAGQPYLALALLNGNGNGGFRISKVTALPSTGCPNFAGCSLKAGDFNGDGKADVAYLDFNGIHVLLGNGDGAFQPAFEGIAPGSNGMVVRDLNGDGITDIALLENSTSKNAVSVLLSLGNGSFSVANYPLEILPVSLAVADLNGDGSPELIAGAGSGALTVLQNSGNGSFTSVGSWAAFVYPGNPLLAGAFLTAGHPSLLTNSAVLPVANQ